MSEAPLIDVTGLTMDDLVGTDDPNLRAAVQRVVASLDDPNGVISAFGSFVADD